MAKTSKPLESTALDALGDPIRRAIVEILRDGSHSVQQIADRLPVSRPAVSRHLRLLKQAELVTDRPDGARRVYELRPEGIDAVRTHLEGVWTDAARRFRLVAENTVPSQGEAGGPPLAPQRSIQNAKALYRKLGRTFDRRSTYGQHQVDWVFDFAVTAWHLVDWVARDSDAGGNSARSDAKKRLTLQCPELFVCEQICNGAKHLVLDDPQLKPFNVATDVRGTTDLSGIRLNIVAGAGLNHDVVCTPAVVVTDKDGHEWHAIELFHRVLSFWQRELGIPPVE